MPATPRLLTSECSAHYPRLWNLVETFSGSRSVRRYPIILDTISFTQQFAEWINVNTEHIANVLDLDFTIPDVQVQYGADPVVAERLEFFADHIGEFLLVQEDIAKQMLYDLAEWHFAILLRTANSVPPKYFATKSCPECKRYSILRYEKDFFCCNNDCNHAWVKE